MTCDVSCFDKSSYHKEITVDYIWLYIHNSELVGTGMNKWMASINESLRVVNASIMETVDGATN